MLWEVNSLSLSISVFVILCTLWLTGKFLNEDVSENLAIDPSLSPLLIQFYVLINYLAGHLHLRVVAAAQKA